MTAATDRARHQITDEGDQPVTETLMQWYRIVRARGRVEDFPADERVSAAAVVAVRMFLKTAAPDFLERCETTDQELIDFVVTEAVLAQHRN